MIISKNFKLIYAIKIDDIPKEQLVVNFSDDMLLLAAILGFFISLILFYLGRKGKQMYLWLSLVVGWRLD